MLTHVHLGPHIEEYDAVIDRLAKAVHSASVFDMICGKHYSAFGFTFDSFGLNRYVRQLSPFIVFSSRKV